jgi:hypothetical protein
VSLLRARIGTSVRQSVCASGQALGVGNFGVTWTADGMVDAVLTCPDLSGHQTWSEHRFKGGVQSACCGACGYSVSVMDPTYLKLFGSA